MANNNVIKKIKIKQADGTFSDYYPIGANAQNVTDRQGYDLQQVLGDIDVDNDGSVAAQLEDIDNEEVLYYFNPQSQTLIDSGATNKIVGECQIIKAYGKTIMIDTGGINRSQSIKTYLQSIGVNKVDYLIISHWHYDHCTNFYSNMDYIDWSDCICYFPLEIPAWVTESTSYYNQCVTFANSNCKQVIFPVDYDELVLNKFFKITFFNCGASAFNEIKEIEDDINDYAGYWTGNGYPNQYYFNDYSMLALVQHNGNKILYSGDAMKANQERAYLAGFGANVDLYKMHHHGVNKLDEKNCAVNLQYCTMVNPKSVIIMNGTQGDMGYVYQTDVNFFSNSDIYYAVYNIITFATKNGHCYQKTNAKKVGVASAEWQPVYIFISPDDYGANYIPDGSYNRPFWDGSGAISYFNSSPAKNCNNLVFVFKPCSNADRHPGLENTIGRETKVTFESYDYYKNGDNAFPVDATGVFTQEAITNLKKYKIRAYVRNSLTGDIAICGLCFMPTDASLSQISIGNKYYVPIQTRNGTIDINRCMISYEEVTKDSTSFYWGAKANPFGTLRVNHCYFYDCILGVAVQNDGVAYLTYCSGDNILKWAGQDGGKVRYNGAGLGATLRNVHLGRPSWTSLTDQICWHIYCTIEVFGDTSNNYCYDSSDNLINFEHWMRKVNQYPWNYRNIVPEFIEHRDYTGNNPVLGCLSSNNGSQSYAIDAYGANLRDYSLGAVTTTPGYDLAAKASVIEYDLDNLQTIGVYYIAGASAAERYSNCPTLYNCRIVVSKLTSGSYLIQEVQSRDGAVYRRVYDSSQTNPWSAWQTIISPATWN